MLRTAVLAIACLAMVLLAPGAAGAATPLTIGTGHKPGVAVDAAGTAYIAWYGPEGNVTSDYIQRAAATYRPRYSTITRFSDMLLF